MKTLASWSVEDYHRMIEAGILGDRRVELLEGEIVEISPEGPTHAFYGEEIADYLRSCLGEKALVREARPITLSDSEPEPDIAVIKPPRIRYRDRHPGPNDIFLLIEIFQSTQAYDLGDKQKTYAAAGIQEYWVVDLKAKQMTLTSPPLKRRRILKRMGIRRVVNPSQPAYDMIVLGTIIHTVWEQSKFP